MRNPQLEKIALLLRSALEINHQNFLCERDFEDLVDKIQRYLEGYKVKFVDGESKLILENENNFILCVGGNLEQRFYNLCEQLAFSILLDKKKLNYYQLERSDFHFPKTVGDHYYLMLAFIMPEETFWKFVIKYLKSDGKIYFNNEDINIYILARARNLEIF